MAIHFDPTNLSAAMVGVKHGLTPEEAAAGHRAALAALAAFHNRVETGEIGFPHLPFQAALIKEIKAYAKSVAGAYDTVCVAGIGGSALGAWALDCGLRGPHPVQAAFSTDNPRLVILDNVDPVFIESALESMNPAKTIVVPVAKSGSTAETMSTFLMVHEWLRAKLGARKAAARIVAVTSAGRGDLKKFALEHELTTFHIPENVGGRFSVLSAVGLVPAALAGLDIATVCKGAAEMTALAWKEDLEANIALKSALLEWLIWTRRHKSIQVAFPYANRLWGAAFWFRQLWAESLGKAKNRKGRVVNTGQTPIAALGATDQHSQVQLYREGPNDKVYSFWAVGKWAATGRIPKEKTGLEGFDYLAGQSLSKLIDYERRATAAALTTAERPNCTYTLDKLDAWHLGAFLQMLEFQTAFCGELLGIDAFDQPGVELGKVFTFGLMGRKGYEEYAAKYKAYEEQRAGVKL
ncbi:MAG: glucose-6-phosphate isomerase [Bryobacteraceae bacterium]